jgi:hypothetical protein
MRRALTAAVAAIAVALTLALAVAVARAPAAGRASGTVWLCEPGLAHDPCTSSLATTFVKASGARSTIRLSTNAHSPFDCFYAYPTVSPEAGPNADLSVGSAEIGAAISQASQFSQVCHVYAPIYRQVTLPYLTAHLDLDFQPGVTNIAFDSIRAGFEAFVHRAGKTRPFVVIGHSQGAAMLILLLRQLVDDVPALRKRLVTAIILGGNVEVPDGRRVGGSFQHIPVCDRQGETGCVIAYSSYPSAPPADALFGRPGQGVSLQSDQLGATGLQVACVDPAAMSGGSALLDPYFPSQRSVPTPWVSYPGLYRSRCEQQDGASWLEVTKATGGSDTRPLVTEVGGSLFGYHTSDVNLALGDLVSDVAAAETTWTASHPS